MNMIRTPVSTFFDRDGTPLESGYVYIGQTGMDARTNPIQVYLDDALTITIDQPIRTLAGYPAYQGGPIQLFVAEPAFTCTVLDKNQVSVFANMEMEIFEGADFRALLAGAGGAALVGNQLPFGVDLAIQPVSDFINNNVLMPSQFAGTAEQQILAAIDEANQSRNGGLGQTVLLPRGETEMTASFNVGNRCSLIGVNKRGSRLIADAAHTGPYMVTVINGTTSTFDNALERMTLDCNDVAGLGGVVADAWQEGGGLRNVLIQKFRTYGAYVRNGYGGAATLLIDGSELFGSAVAAATAGIYVEEVSIISNFLVHVTNSTITGGPGTPMSYGIYVENDSLHCHVVHFEEAVSGIYLDGGGNHVLIGVTGASTVTNVVEIASTFTGSVTMIGCFRGGATNLLKDNRAAGFGTIAVDRDIRIDTRPPLALGSIMAAGVLNGATVTLTKGYGLASVVRTAAVPAGSYDLTLTTTAQTANDWAPFASSNGFEGNVRCTNIGVDSVRIETFNAAGALTDVNQIKFQVVRVA